MSEVFATAAPLTTVGVAVTSLQTMTYLSYPVKQREMYPTNMGLKVSDFCFCKKKIPHSGSLVL